MSDLTTLWDFDDPAGSEQRFRAGAAAHLTQVARALGLQERFEEAHAVLDGIDPAALADAEVGVRALLERGRLHRTAGSPGDARRFFDEAAAAAAEAGLDALAVDALHMVALVAPPEEQLALTERALGLARSSSDQAARDWEPSLLNNLGMTHADCGDWPAALAAFEEALAGRRRLGDTGRTNVARWMVGWALRHLGRTDEALGVQRALKADLDAAGEHDPYVEEELALLE